MKKLFSFFLIILFLISFPTLIFAKENIPPQREKILKSNEIVNKDYFATGEYVAVHGTVNGDIYLVGGNILVDGIINGDIIALGGSIIIEAKQVKNIRTLGGTILINSKEINGNITAFGGQIDIPETSTVLGSIVSGAGNLRIAGPIERGMHLIAGQILISNDVGGDVFAGGEKIRITQNAKIDGNFNYWSKNKAEITDNAQISGKITQNMPPNIDKLKTGGKVMFTTAMIIKTLIDFVAAIILGIIFIFFLPVFTNKVIKSVEKNFLKNLGVGFLTTILTPILFLVLIITIIGIPFSFLILFIYLVLAFFSKIFISIFIGQKVFKYLSLKNESLGWNFIIGLFVYYLISFIPVIGAIFTFLVMILGIGAMLMVKKDYYLFLRTKKIV